MKIPLTLAIIPALIVTCGGDRYAIPQVSLLELVRLERASRRQQASSMIHGRPVYRLRGNLLPLVYLDRELQVELRTARSDERHQHRRAAGRRPASSGWSSTTIHDTEEIVVKPLCEAAQRASLRTPARPSWATARWR